MRRLLILAGELALGLSACGQPTATPEPTAQPTQAITPSPTLVPTATSVVDGVGIRLGTPDPSPNCPNHIPWFFANPVQECADSPANKWAVLQHFEHGLMVWFQDYGETYILIDDGSAFRPYTQAIDSVGIANPTDPDPALIPPPHYFQPLRGFAKFWRGLVPGTNWVRPALGWATAPEVGYSAYYQCNTSAGDAARCYWLGPQDEIIVFARGASAYWANVKGPRP